MTNHLRIIKNAVANLGRGSVAAAVALLMPPVLVRHMTPASYAVWILVFQTAAYINYVNFGLQTAIGRYVAYANERRDVEQRDSVFSTALIGLWIAAVVSLICLIVAVMVSSAIFPSVPSMLIPQMRLALLIVGFSMAIELPASACNGVFVGMERYEIPAFTTGGARLFSALGLIIAALTGRSIVAMAATVALVNLLSYLAQYLALRHVVPDLRFQLHLVRFSTARELYGYCLGLSVMSFSMLLVTGFDLILVGRFEFSTVIPYSVAAIMITFLSGLINAVFNVIMPRAATLHARQKANEMGKLVISSTRLSVLLLILSGIPVLVYARPLLRLWIGQSYVAAGAPLLMILIVANIIRLIGAPYSIVLIAAGQQRYIMISPLAEGLSNFVSSLALGLYMGARGVAFGTLIGAVIGIAAHLSYSMARTKTAIALSPRQFLFSGVFIPMLCTFPLLVVSVVSWIGIEIRPVLFSPFFVFSVLGASMLLFRTEIVPKGGKLAWSHLQN